MRMGKQITRSMSVCSFHFKRDDYIPDNIRYNCISNISIYKQSCINYDFKFILEKKTLFKTKCCP